MDEVRSGDWLDFLPHQLLNSVQMPATPPALRALARHTGSRSPSPGLRLPRKLAMASGDQVNGTP
jgi:hypothetical protein